MTPVGSHLLTADAISETDPPTVPDGIVVRRLEKHDLPQLGGAYFRSYLGTQYEMTADEARDEMRESWSGRFGRWCAPACFGAWRDEDLIGAVITVTDAPWPDVPRGAFITDLFVLPELRRHGIGRALIRSAHRGVGTAIALRVDDAAVEARALDEGYGFRPVRTNEGEHPAQPG